MFVEGRLKPNKNSILSLIYFKSSGLFLFLQVIATFSVEDSRMKFRHYFLLGWGKF